MKIEGEGARITGRFVLLHHEMPEPASEDITQTLPSHWDLMLEPPEKPDAQFPRTDSGQLLTYRLMELPSPKSIPVGDQPATVSPPPDTETHLLLTRLPNHRARYLEYEGPISGNRGSVHKIYSGFYRCESKEEIFLELFTDGPGPAAIQAPTERNLNACIKLSEWGAVDQEVACLVLRWQPG